ncbi:hypothetical protein GT042_17285, partial [Streptomyces sp. SID3212]|nr:hypothetical protein [Streptomyces sp. SID3212]
ESPRAEHPEHASAPDPGGDSETRFPEADPASFRLRAEPPPAAAAAAAAPDPDEEPGDEADFDPPGAPALYSRATVRVRADRPPILTPTPPMISRPLALQRALRPLRGAVPP